MGPRTWPGRGGGGLPGTGQQRRQKSNLPVDSYTVRILLFQAERAVAAFAGGKKKTWRTPDQLPQSPQGWEHWCSRRGHQEGGGITADYLRPPRHRQARRHAANRTPLRYHATATGTKKKKHRPGAGAEKGNTVWQPDD